MVASQNPKNQRSLIEGAALLQNLIDKTSIPTFLVGLDGDVFFANQALSDLLGYSQDEMAGLGISRIVHPGDAADARSQMAALARGEINSYRTERRYVRKNGEAIWVLVSAASLLDEATGAPQYFTLQAVDIDGRKRAEAALAISESRWNAALEAAGQGVWDVDIRNGRHYHSPMWRAMRGIGADEPFDDKPTDWMERIHPDDRARVRDAIARHNSGQVEQSSFEYRERHRDGRWIWILSRGKPIEWTPDGHAARIVGTDTDITALKDREARAAEERAEAYRSHLSALQKANASAEAASQLAQSLARHDALTGLPNRRVFSEALAAAVARAQNSGGIYAAMVVDLDQFKPVNDIHGHPAGDAVLKEVAIRLGNIVDRAVTLARLGGDEFAVLLECDPKNGSPKDSASSLAQRIIERVQMPMEINGSRVRIGATVGIALCPLDGTDPEMLMRSADMAMYDAKQDNRGTFAFFKPTMEADVRARTALEDDVRKAVTEKEILPYYQPLIRLSDDRLVGFEILARWRHPERGPVPPDTFIPVVEKLDLIGDMTYALLERACVDARNWPWDISIALNISPRHFSDPYLPVKILAILSKTGFPPTRLELEITETALVADLPAARASLLALRSCGIKISLDDFGTGYSNLHHLRELRFDKIKIDRSFVLSMDDDRESSKIVRAVIDLAHSLGLPTIAEGIEHEGAMRDVKENGAEYGQGFHFGKAMPVAEANELVRAQRSGGEKRRA